MKSDEIQRGKNMTEKKCPACASGGAPRAERTKHREGEEYKKLIARLNRIEGQVRGIKNMVEEDRYCIDIINQVAAVTAALNGFNKELLSAHIKSCVADDVKNGDGELLDELCAVLHKLMR